MAPRWAPSRRRILASVLSRALLQLGTGVAVGGVLAGVLTVKGTSTAGQAVTLLVVEAALVLTAGLLAALGPARRGLRIQPMQALREEQERGRPARPLRCINPRRGPPVAASG